MKAIIQLEGHEPATVELVPVTKKPRYEARANRIQWHVVDTTREPAGNDKIGAADLWSVACWNTNTIGEGACKAKAEELCKTLNDLEDLVANAKR